MARAKKDTEAAAAMARKLCSLKERRERKDGKLAYDQISREIWASSGYAISGEQIRKYHAGEVDPRTLHLEEIAAIALFYGVRLSALSPIAFERGNRAFDLLSSSFGWITDAVPAAA